MPNPALVELQSRLEQHVADSSLGLTSAVLGDGPNLSDSLMSVLDRMAIRIQNPLIDLAGESLRVTGVADLISPYRARATLVIDEKNGRLSLSVDLDVLTEMGHPMRLEDLLKSLVQAFQIPPEISGWSIPTLSLGDFQETALRAGITEDWTVPLGPGGIAVTDLEIEVGNGKGTLKGTADFGVSKLGFAASLPGDLTLNGRLPQVDVLNLMEELRGSTPSLPAGLPRLELPAADFSIGSPTDAPTFSVVLQDDTLGDVCLAVYEKGGWQSAVVYQLPAGWRFSRLASLLAPLDLLDIRSPQITFATTADDALECPAGAGVSVAVFEGFKFSAELRFETLGLNIIGDLLGIDALPLELATTAGIEDMNVVARVGRETALFEGMLVLKDTLIRVKPKPFALSLEATAGLGFSNLPPMTVSAGITETSTRISAKLEKWEDPLGISGLTINRLVLSMDTNAGEYALLGEIDISGNRQIMVFLKFAGTVPTAIVGELQGKLSLQEVLQALIGMDFPLGILDISIRDFSVYMVAVAGELDNMHFAPGFALQGYLGFFGLEMFVRVIIEPGKGILAEGSLSEIVNIGNVLKLTNANGDGPPCMLLDTRAPNAVLNLSGGFSLLGLEESLDAKIDGNGIEICYDKCIEADIGPAVIAVHYDLAFQGSSPWDFVASGRFSFKLDIPIEDIKEPNTGITLLPGFNLVVTELSGDVRFAMSDQGFSQSVSFKFEYLGITFSAGFSLDIRDLRHLPQAIADYIVNHSFEIFSQLFKDADPLAILIGLAEGLIELGQRLWDAFESLGDEVVKVFDAIAKVDLLALPAIGALPIEAWETMPANVWEDAGEWSAEKWHDMADWSADTWNKAENWTEDQWNKVKGSESIATDFLEKTFGIKFPKWSYNVIPRGIQVPDPITPALTNLFTHTAEVVKETGGPSGGCYACAPPDPDLLPEQNWQWCGSEHAPEEDDEGFPVWDSRILPAAETSSLVFNTDGTFRLKVGCNKAAGTYTTPERWKISFHVDEVTQDDCDHKEQFDYFVRALPLMHFYCFSLDRGFYIDWEGPEDENFYPRGKEIFCAANPAP